MKRVKRTICLVLALVMLLTVVLLTGCVQTKPQTTSEPGASSQPGDETKSTYTYQTYSTSLGNNWNPHTWETNADDTILTYLSSPLVDLSIKDSKTGEYQWVYEMATSVEDVTKDHQDDLTKYKVSLPAGKNASDITEGYVYEIKLNPNAKWQNGEQINADTYVYSMKALLDPKMRNYRSNLYWGGESAVAGGATYYNSGAPLYECVAYTGPDVDADNDGQKDLLEDYAVLEKAVADGTLYINTTTTSYELYSKSLSTLISDYGSLLADPNSATTIKDIGQKENAYGYAKITAENKDAVFGALLDLLMNLFDLDEATAKNSMCEALFVWDGTSYGDVVEYDGTVGCYKVDDFTIRYVNQVAIERPTFYTSLTSNWIVYEKLYEGGKDTTGELVTTNYGTSPETTMSYGVWKLDSLQEDKQIVFVKNENWYGWDAAEKEKGNLVSYTQFDVDGQKRPQYVTDKIVIDVMTDDAAKLAFLAGKIDDWTPNADELTTYASSDQLYRVDETYSMSLFFNTNETMLKAMDESKGNKNSIVLSNFNFRNAMSLAIDRAEWVTATAGYKPLFGFMGKLYYYDVWNNPASVYRNSDPAM